MTGPVNSVPHAQCCVVGRGTGRRSAGAPAGAQRNFRKAPGNAQEFRPRFPGRHNSPVSHGSAEHEIGLAERLLELRHTKLPKAELKTTAGPYTIADFSRLKSRYPYITLIPQVRFLGFITGEAKRYPHFELLMGANVHELIEEQGVICGARYLGDEGTKEVRALVTVGADGRFSRSRRLAGMEPIKTAPPMDVLWFRLPRELEDPEHAGVVFHIGGGRFLILLDRGEEGDWQVGYVIAKGSYQRLRAAGLETLRRSIVELVPEFAGRVEHLKEWSQVSVLSVESSRLLRWWRPGLLLIGDAAHVMSPVGRRGDQLRNPGRRCGCEHACWAPKGWAGRGR